MGLGAAGACREDEMTLLLVVTCLVALYCLIRGIIDLRQRRYAWRTIGLLCAGLLLSTPIQSHAVKYDVLVAGQ
jgi:hypothetical protein